MNYRLKHIKEACHTTLENALFNSTGCGEQLRIIANFIKTGKIKPIIDRVFPFEDTQKAMEYAESGRAKGKIILKIR